MQRLFISARRRSSSDCGGYREARATHSKRRPASLRLKTICIRDSLSDTKSCLTADTPVLIFVTVMVVLAPLRAVISQPPDLPRPFLPLSFCRTSRTLPADIARPRLGPSGHHTGEAGSFKCHAAPVRFAPFRGNESKRRQRENAALLALQIRDRHIDRAAVC